MFNHRNVVNSIWLALLAGLLALLSLIVISNLYTGIPSFDECNDNKPYGMSILLYFIYAALSVVSAVLTFFSLDVLMINVIDYCRGKANRLVYRLVGCLGMTVLSMLLVFITVYSLYRPCSIMLPVNTLVSQIIIGVLTSVLVSGAGYSFLMIKVIYSEEFLKSDKSTTDNDLKTK